MNKNNSPRQGRSQGADTAERLLEDQLKVLFDSPLGLALRNYLWDLLEEEVDRLHADGSRAAAHTAGGIMQAQRIVLPEKADNWAAEDND